MTNEGMFHAGKGCFPLRGGLKIPGLDEGETGPERMNVNVANPADAEKGRLAFEESRAAMDLKDVRDAAVFREGVIFQLSALARNEGQSMVDVKKEGVGLKARPKLLRAEEREKIDAQAFREPACLRACGASEADKGPCPSRLPEAAPHPQDFPSETCVAFLFRICASFVTPLLPAVRNKPAMPTA